MGYSRVKQRSAVEFSIEAFFRRHPSVWYWTFTTADNCTSKQEAWHRAKPFFDLVKRRGGEFLGVWERQDRGAWHLHVLVNKFFDVNWLRPWMVKRGWGPQMFVKRAEVATRFVEDRWVIDMSSIARLVRYLGKYVTKSLEDDYGHKVKPFTCAASARASTVRFAWLPEVNACAYLWAWGRAIFFDMFGRPATFRDSRLLIQIGLEDSGWSNVDPWFTPP